MSFYGEVEVGARAGVGQGPTDFGPRDAGPRMGLRARCLMAGLSQQAESVVTVEMKRGAKLRTMTKQEKFPHLPNGLVELLGESF